MTRARIGIGLALLIGLSAAIGPLLVPHDPIRPNYLARYAAPSAVHPLGTDNLGRDVLARSLAGGRVSLSIAGGATVLAVMIGLLTGLTAAGVRGAVDVLLTRAFDALLAFPGFLLVLLLVTILGGGVGQTVLALGVAGSPLYFRLVRAFTRGELQRDYVLAGAALGASRPRLLFRHALPNFAGALAVQALTLGVLVMDVGKTSLPEALSTAAPRSARSSGSRCASTSMPASSCSAAADGSAATC